jgi:hypothetical protein
MEPSCFWSIVQPLTSAYPYYAFPDSWNDVYWNLDAHADAELKKLVKAGHWNGVRPDLIVQRGPVSASILAFAQAQSVDLIVMGTHGRQGLDRLAMGSVAERVLRNAACPVLVVRKPLHDFVAHEKGRDPVQLRKILFCTDFSESQRGYEVPLSLAMEYNAELTLLHVLKPFRTPLIFKAPRPAIQEMQTLIHRMLMTGAQSEHGAAGKALSEIVQLALKRRPIWWLWECAAGTS